MSQPQYFHTPSRPSPLAQVHLTRPNSTKPQQQQPSQGLVRDPLFWKRFSTAVHANEQPIDLESARRNTGSTSSSVESKRGDEWLAQQRKEKRRCRALCVSITMAVIVIIAGATFVGWYFTKVKKIHISL